MGLKIWNYRLTAVGKLGAVLFVAPTPIAGFYSLPPAVTASEARFNERLRALGSAVETFSPSPTVLILLATAMLVGAVMLFVGRELISYEA